MAKKKITARIYIAGKAIAKVTYETRDDSFNGKRIARLALDEFAGYTMACADNESWAITYTDEDAAEFAFTSTDKANAVNVEVEGEVIGTIDGSAYERVEAMWSWLKERGWY